MRVNLICHAFFRGPSLLLCLKEFFTVRGVISARREACHGTTYGLDSGRMRGYAFVVPHLWHIDNFSFGTAKMIPLL